MTVLFQVVMGVSLAACAGLRAFLPLFVAGVAGRFELIPLSESFEWMAGTPALVVLGVAVVTELLADKIPAVDNFLDGLQTFVKPVAGTILAASVLTDMPIVYATALGLITGGGTAAAVHVSKAQVRLASSVATVGVANPLISFLEDVAALVGSLLSLFFPLIVVLGLFVAVIVVWRLLRTPTREPGAG
jgi:hypothetical protein